MPWNQTGGTPNQKDPWGNSKNNQGPPDLDQIVKNLISKIKYLFLGNKATSDQSSSSNGKGTVIYASILSSIALVIFSVWFLAGLFIVNPAEEAVILRLGKFIEVMPSGLHWIPPLIDSKYLVDIQKIYSFSVQGDFITKSSEQGDLPNQYLQTVTPSENKNPDKKNPDAIDRSKNLVNVELNVQYRVKDPRAYLFGSINPDQTVQAAASGALSDAIGQMKLDEVLTTGRELVSAGVRDKIKNILQNYNTGIEVIAVTLRKVQAPDQVREAFSDVNRADQDRATLIQHAQAYASKVVPIAQGEAARILADAVGYRQQVVLNAQADIAKYQALAKVYQSFPDVTRERLYLQSMQNILKNSSKILVDTGSSNNVFYLPLDQLAQNKRIINLKTASDDTTNNHNDIMDNK